MTKQLTGPRSQITAVENFNASDYVPSGIIEQYKEQQEALLKTTNIITDAIRSGEKYRSLNGPSVLSRASSGGGLCFEASHKIEAMGLYSKSQVMSRPHIEASTLNLLLSVKLLSTKEKRKLLKSRGLADFLDESEGEAEIEDKEPTEE